ncbi:MAG: kinase [Xanthomonadales bacterium]|nr:kinase [Xanthomonadales bacterium]
MREDASMRGAGDPALEAALALLLRQRQPALAGLSGVPGSGKSTFAAALERLAASRGVGLLVLTLDDFYLTRDARQRLAREVHPLLATRGVPGTHEIELLGEVLAALPAASPARPVRVPRFDKGRDTRLPPSRWRRVERPPDIMLLEGWCVGVPPQPAAALATPCNTLEREEDADGRWRRWVNAQLAGPYASLWRELEGLIVLQAPGFEVVRGWRAEQERPRLAQAAPHALDDATLERFLMHYERLGRHALRSLPARADLCIVLDRERRVQAIRPSPAAR